MVAGTRADAEALREQAAEVLAGMGLRLSPAKTMVVHLDDGLDFLGFHQALRLHLPCEEGG
jgi:RNA-directed DNA polymerase